MTILAICGDVGGMKAAMPVIEKLHSSLRRVLLYDNQNLVTECPIDTTIVRFEDWSDAEIRNWVDREKISLVFSTTSVKDSTPLKVSRKLQSMGIPVFTLLDNWMNYRYRLELDGEGNFIPDRYLLMDPLAKMEAQKDALPEEILTISGQPALHRLDTISEEYKKQVRGQIEAKLRCKLKTSLICFISEPAEQDQGGSADHPDYRGYTEKEVLRRLLKSLQPYAHEASLVVLPHPREQRNALDAIWSENGGGLTGGIVQGLNSSEVILTSNGTTGMTSILLYESWLFNHPTISLQPNLRKEDLKTLQKRAGVIFVEREDDWDSLFASFMDQTYSFDGTNSPIRDELRLHQESVSFITELIGQAIE